MRVSGQPVPNRPFCNPAVAVFSLTALFCCGCATELEAVLEMSPPKAQVNASWPGQPPTSADQFGFFYGGLIDAIADGLLEACGGPARRQTRVVVCYEPRLTAAQANLLADNAADIFLPQLETLEPDAAKALAKSTGILWFGSLQSLSPNAAAMFAGRRDALDLSCITRLSAEAASGLAGNEGSLKLNGLETLEPGVAAALGRHAGQLSLNGLEQLSAADAAELAHHRGDLCLNGLLTISAEAAEPLATLPYGLHLNAIAEISAATAAALSSHCGWCLGLNGLQDKQLSPQDSRALLP